MKPKACKHPNELDLAALAGGDVSFLRQTLLHRHLQTCDECQDHLTAFRDLRENLAATAESNQDLPDLNWDRLAAEMRANIHLGLEAGECVRQVSARGMWRDRLLAPLHSARLALAFASLLLLAGAGFFMRDYRTAASPNVIGASAPVTATPEYRLPVLESSMSGIEMRTGPISFAFLNREGGAASPTVSAQGAVRSRDIDAETGSVTIKDVYLQ
jgi:hypothetical protein